MSELRIGDMVTAPRFYGDADYGGVGVIEEVGTGGCWIVRFGIAYGGFDDDELVLVVATPPEINARGS